MVLHHSCYKLFFNRIRSGLIGKLIISILYMHYLILRVLYALTKSLDFLALLSYLNFPSQCFCLYTASDNNIHLRSLIVKKLNQLISIIRLIIFSSKWPHNWIRIVHWEQPIWGRKCFDSHFKRVQPIMMGKVW